MVRELRGARGHEQEEQEQLVYPPMCAIVLFNLVAQAPMAADEDGCKALSTTILSSLSKWSSLVRLMGQKTSVVVKSEEVATACPSRGIWLRRHGSNIVADR